MNALLILIPVSLLLIAGATAVFFWAVRHNQFDDLDTPEILPLLDIMDETPEISEQSAGEVDHNDPHS